MMRLRLVVGRWLLRPLLIRHAVYAARGLKRDPNPESKYWIASLTAIDAILSLREPPE